MENSKYVLVLDIGTTNIKAFLFNKEGKIFAQARKRPRYILDEPGQVEQDPNEIWDLSKEAMQEVINSKNLTSENIDSIGICTQRGSFLLWDQRKEKTYSNVITWQDKRCAEYAEKKTNSFKMKMIRGITKFLYLITRKTKMLTASMLRFNTDYASARTGYFLKHNSYIKEMLADPKTDIRWGTLDTWIVWKLTEGKVHSTDYSNASSTGLLDPFTLEWNPIVLSTFEIPEYILPEIKDTRDDYGTTKLFGGEIPIKAVVADQQASLFGQCCFNFGDMKITNGTGSFVDINTGNTPFASKRKLYPLIAWRINGETTYMLEGLSHNTGNIIDWIKEELELFDDPQKTEEMAKSVESTKGIYFVPAFTSGLGFPWHDPTARGNIFGISLTTKKEHIVRAVLEGICLRVRDFVEGIIEDTGIDVETIKADGGVSQNEFILQFLSDILGKKIEHSLDPEMTALGTAFMSGIATGFWKSKEELISIRRADTYSPIMTEEERESKYAFWNDIIRRSLNYLKD
ncbi:MAG: putative glycerol kinase [Promethearchaeota archaeon]|nr:MAG: putative glycerol kinase [Candidatus Lokiarchaeota archaeon]